jgi:Glycosyl transferase family 4
VTGVVAGGVAFLVAGALVPLLVRYAVGRNLLDVPNLRSSHEVPTPRLGGVAIFLGMLAGVAILRPEGLWPLLAAAALVWAVGLADDLSNLHFGVKAVLQALAAVGLLLIYPPTILSHAPGVLGALVFVVGVFWIVALSNAFNFMDGIDGFTGGVALINALFLAPLVGPAGGFLPALIGATDLEHKPRVHLYWGFGSLLPRLQPGRGSLLRPRALGTEVDAFGLPGLRGCLHALPLRHRIYAGSAVAKRGWEEHLPGSQGAHLPADHPDHGDAQAY